MADGGIHDQLGGGFHRYATDARWLVPHFEQMLYDNAQLARVYIHAWQLTGDARYRDVAVGTLDFLLRELRTPGGGLRGQPGRRHRGRRGGDVHLAGRPRSARSWATTPPLFEAAYGVTEAGNWEGVTILSRVRDDAELADRFGLAPAEVGERLAPPRAAARWQPRAARPQPARDDKVLAAWNGLAIAALADASRALEAGAPALADRADRYREAAVAAADDVLAGLRARARTAAALVEGRPGDRRRRPRGLRGPGRRPARPLRGHRRRALVRRGRRAGRGHPGPLRRPGGRLLRHGRRRRERSWSARGTSRTTPSRPAARWPRTVLLRLAALTGEPRYRAAAERALATVGPYLARYPTAFAQWLCALEVAHEGIIEVAIVGGDADAARARCVRAASRTYGPFRVLAVSPRRRPRRPSRCCATGSRSTAAPPRSSAATSPVASRSTSPRRSRPCWSGT